MTTTTDTTNAGVNDPVAALWGHPQGRTPGSFTPALVLRLQHRLRERRRHKAPAHGRVRPNSRRQKRLSAVRGHGATRGERTSREGYRLMLAYPDGPAEHRTKGMIRYHSRAEISFGRGRWDRIHGAIRTTSDGKARARSKAPALALCRGTLLSKLLVNSVGTLEVLLNHR